MEDWIWLIVIGAVVVLGLLAYGAWKAKQSKQVKDQFGPEYERLSSDRGHREAVGELTERQKRREQLDVRPLSSDSAERYRQSWTQTQTHFVDQPDVAVKEADTLVTSVMVERGYPMNDFEQRAADISVDHPDLVTNYRASHTISERAEEGEATTEELRQAMVHYRALFNELVETPAEGAGGEQQSSDDDGTHETFRPQR